MEPSALWAEVVAAFAEEPYPGDEHLVEDPSHPDDEETLEVIRGRHWSELDPQKVFSVYMLTDAAFRFFAPFLLHQDIFTRDFGMSKINELFLLCQPGHLQERVDARWRSMTRAQREAVARVIRGFGDPRVDALLAAQLERI